jgi:hypothetical protein
VISWADEVWEDELMRQSQMATGIAALSPAQRTAYEAERQRAAAEAEAYSKALMARLEAEAEARADKTPSVHPILLMREKEEGADLLSRGWAMEDALWDQPFSSYLEERFHGVYDCGSMPERDYAAFMQWLFSNGFEACAQNHRGIVQARWADLPARHWKPTKAAKWRPEEGTIQRFCIKCPWGLPVEGCKYVHGDVIHRVNFPCKFALTCKGTKRTQCLHMHPDETWTPELVIRRPGALVPEPLVPVGFPMTGPPMVAPVVPVAVPVMASGGSQASVEPEEAYEGAWDAEDFVEPEVKVIRVTAEEMELEERNKRNRAIQAGHDLTSASASALALADSILAQDKAATARSHAIPGYKGAARKERIRLLFNALSPLERAALPPTVTVADFDLLGDRLMFVGASESEERDGLYGLNE